MTAFQLTVNGEARQVDDALVGESLLYVLRNRLGLPGSKNACEEGECGSCSVLLDDELVCACLELGAAAAGCDVVTVEGLAPPASEPAEALLTDVQRAMVEAGGVQCGFCTPGFVVAIHDLLARQPEPTPLAVREALAGNLCRCTGYGRIVAAVEAVVVGRRAPAEVGAGAANGTAGENGAATVGTRNDAPNGSDGTATTGAHNGAAPTTGAQNGAANGRTEAADGLGNGAATRAVDGRREGGAP